MSYSDKDLEEMRKTKKKMIKLYASVGMPWRLGIDKWEWQGYPSWWDTVE